jgi:hypothetical protein
MKEVRKMIDNHTPSKVSKESIPIHNEDSDRTVLSDDEFIPTDPHPYRTCTIIEDNGFLFKEREMNGLIFYDTLEMLDDPDKTLDIIKDSNTKGFVDTVSDTDYLNLDLRNTNIGMIGYLMMHRVGLSPKE